MAEKGGKTFLAIGGQRELAYRLFESEDSHDDELLIRLLNLTMQKQLAFLGDSKIVDISANRITDSAGCD